MTAMTPPIPANTAVTGELADPGPVVGVCDSVDSVGVIEIISDVEKLLVEKLLVDIVSKREGEGAGGATIYKEREIERKNK